MTESAFNRPVPVQEQQAARKAEPKPTPLADAIAHGTDEYDIFGGAPTNPPQPIPGTEGRELTEAEASAAIEAAMHERIAEAINNDLETRARVAAIPVSGFAAQITEERGLRYEGTFQGNPIVSDPSLPPGFVGAVTLTAEQLEATKHLKPGEAWAKAGKALEPEPAKKPEDLDGF